MGDGTEGRWGWRVNPVVGLIIIYLIIFQRVSESQCSYNYADKRKSTNTKTNYNKKYIIIYIYIINIYIYAKSILIYTIIQARN